MPFCVHEYMHMHIDGVMPHPRDMRICSAVGHSSRRDNTGTAMLGVKRGAGVLSRVLLLGHSPAHTRSSGVAVRSLSFMKLSEEEAMEDRLRSQLGASFVRVTDISGGCGSMYHVQVHSTKFAGLRMVQQHRMVNEVLKDNIKDMHGIRIETQATQH